MGSHRNFLEIKLRTEFQQTLDRQCCSSSVPLSRTSLLETGRHFCMILASGLKKFRRVWIGTYLRKNTYQVLFHAIFCMFWFCNFCGLLNAKQAHVLREHMHSLSQTRTFQAASNFCTSLSCNSFWSSQYIWAFLRVTWTSSVSWVFQLRFLVVVLSWTSAAFASDWLLVMMTTLRTGELEVAMQLKVEVVASSCGT